MASPVNRKTAAELARRLQSSGGFTYSPSTGSFPESGVAVSIAGHEDVKRMGTPMENASRIRGYARHHRDALVPDGYTKSNKVDPGARGGMLRSIGAWRDAGMDYLDVSEVLPDATTGRQAILNHNQIAGFDLGSFTEIRNPYHAQFAENHPDITMPPSTGPEAAEWVRSGIGGVAQPRPKPKINPAVYGHRPAKGTGLHQYGPGRSFS